MNDRVLLIEGTERLALNVQTLESFHEILGISAATASVITRAGVMDLYGDRPQDRFDRVVELEEYFAPGRVEAVAIELLETEHFDIIFAPREFELLKAARLREQFGIPGQSVEEVLRFRDKWLMKAAARNCGIQVWPADKVDDWLDARAATKAYDRLVVKPRTSAGGDGAIVPFTSADMELLVQRMNNRWPDESLGMVAEPFCTLPMWHFDGLWHEEALAYLFASVYVGGGLDIRIDDVSEQLTGSLMRRVSADDRVWIERLLSAFCDGTTISFHCEAWRAADGQLFLNEIAARTGGGFVHTNAITALGAEPDALLLAAQLGLDPMAYHRVPRPPRLVAGVSVPYRSGYVVAAPLNCPVDGVVAFSCRDGVGVGRLLPVQDRWYQMLADATLVAENEAQLDRELEKFAAWSRDSFQITPPPTSVVIVDPMSGGEHLREAAETRGLDVVLVASDRSKGFYSSTSADEDGVSVLDESIGMVALVEEARRRGVTAVLAGAETGVELAYTLAAALNLETNGSSATALRDKAEMLGIASSRGIAVPPTAVVRLLASNVTHDRLLGGDLVAKPSMSAGTDGVRVGLSSHEALSTAVSLIGRPNATGGLNAEALIQPRVGGVEYAVNSVAMLGRTWITSVWRYTKTVDPSGSPLYLHDEAVCPWTDQAAREACDYALACLEALGVRVGPAHTEVILSPAGPVLVELAARPSGSLHPAMEVECFGRSQAALSVNLLLSMPGLEESHPRLLEFGCVVNLVVPAEGLRLGVAADQLRTKLPTALDVSLRHAIGARLPMTRDLISSPGVVQLVGERSEVLRDIETLRVFEAGGLYV